MKRIIIDFIPHKDQRYDTCGDWIFNDDIGKGDYLVIKVSETIDWRSSALVAVHELIEAILCKHAGITSEQVDAFDIGWKSPGPPIEEPGDDPRSPYFHQHQFATEIEEYLCNQLDYSWYAHQMSVDELE